MGKKRNHKKKNQKIINLENKRKENVLLVADSHGRQLINTFNKFSSLNLTSIISPGATFEYVFQNLELYFNNTYSKVIIIAGTNDVDDCGFINHSFFRTHQSLLRFCDHNPSVDVIVVTVPRRKDRVSCAVRNSNSKLNSVLYNSFGLYSVLDISRFGRQLFTRQGLHLNSAGKIELTGVLINVISAINNSKYSIFLMRNTVSSPRMCRD